MERRRIEMAKKKIFVVGLILLVLIIGGGAYFVGRSAKKKISLEDLQQEGEYQYLQLEWGISVDDAKRKFKIPMETDPSRIPAPDTYEFYKTKERFLLDGQTADASLEFKDYRLEALQFCFEIDENAEEWFKKQIGQLQELVGAESEAFENGEGPFRSRSYKWETEKTTLQVVLIYGTNANVIFSLGSK